MRTVGGDSEKVRQGERKDWSEWIHRWGVPILCMPFVLFAVVLELTAQPLLSRQVASDRPVSRYGQPASFWTDGGVACSLEDTSLSLTVSSPGSFIGAQWRRGRELLELGGTGRQGSHKKVVDGESIRESALKVKEMGSGKSLAGSKGTAPFRTSKGRGKSGEGTSLQTGSGTRGRSLSGARKNGNFAASLITIFCAPSHPFIDLSEDDVQRLALLSWLRLSDSVRVVLIGNDSSFWTVAAKYPGRVSVEPNIDVNLEGVALFNSIVARAEAVQEGLAVIIDASLLLFSDFLTAARHVGEVFENWLLTAATWQIEKKSVLADYVVKGLLGEAKRAEAARMKTLAMEGPSKRWEFVEEQREQHLWDADVAKNVRLWGTLASTEEPLFFAWNAGQTRLFENPMPPFAVRNGEHNSWLLQEAMASRLRMVVDASTAMTVVEIAGLGDRLGDEESWGEEQDHGGHSRQAPWAEYVNAHLARAGEGSFVSGKGTPQHIQWQLSRCSEPSLKNACLLRRERPGNCSCTYSPYALKTTGDPTLHVSYYTCGFPAREANAEAAAFALTSAVISAKSSSGAMPFSKDILLQRAARHVGGLKVITLVAVSFSYANILMAFVCRLRKLGLADNLVIAAFDEEVYEFGVRRGLPIYFEAASLVLRFDMSVRVKCYYRTDCFRQITKVKSRTVLSILEMGYSVLWTDVDVVWFSDPLPHLLSYGPDSLAIQSNEPDHTKAGTGIHRLNSGFYFARAEESTLEAFKSIVSHAAKSRRSEQPSFYDVLCGSSGERVRAGEEVCVWTNGLRVVFLDRKMYPNGAVHGLWDLTNTTEGCEALGCVILHNNWIAGQEAKEKRMVLQDLWKYDVKTGMCIYPWTKTTTVVAIQDEE
eukprot:TRINITY_DN126_c0_g1_i1.p1 TRINITY_DN126_c0_g1~~TRINITY_DN126_c0_g1_i1.p1  ORF type:complete len:877 (-),score=90.30 TRINITY_DN126_c0_g1_i1:489-3119(-)